MTSKIDICNFALSRLGDNATIKDIDNPTEQQEKVFAVWFDSTRRSLLGDIAPNFAKKRNTLALSEFKPEFGYDFAYEYPKNCLRVMGVGDLDNTINNYSVEGGYILTNDYANGLPIRYIEDVTDYNLYDDNFIDLFSFYLAKNVAPEISANQNKQNFLQQVCPVKARTYLAMQGQENKPIIVTRSRLLNARRGIHWGVNKK